MDKQPKQKAKADGLVTYTSTSRQLSPTLRVPGVIEDEAGVIWNKDMGNKKILHFDNHIFRTRNRRIIKAADDKIQEWKDRGVVPFFMRIDEAELMKAKVPNRVAVKTEEGVEMVDIKDIQEALKLYKRKNEPQVVAGLRGTILETSKTENNDKNKNADS